LVANDCSSKLQKKKKKKRSRVKRSTETKCEVDRRHHLLRSYGSAELMASWVTSRAMRLRKDVATFSINRCEHPNMRSIAISSVTSLSCMVTDRIWTDEVEGGLDLDAGCCCFVTQDSNASNIFLASVWQYNVGGYSSEHASLRSAGVNSGPRSFSPRFRDSI